MKATSKDKQLQFFSCMTRGGNYKVVIHKFLSKALNYLIADNVYGFKTKESAENYIKKKAKKLNLTIEV